MNIQFGTNNGEKSPIKLRKKNSQKRSSQTGFSKFKTALSVNYDLQDITNTPSKVPALKNIENQKRFSLDNVQLIQSQYSSRTNELEQRIESYQNQISSLRTEIGEKTVQNNILRQKNLRLMNQNRISTQMRQGIKSGSNLLVQQSKNNQNSPFSSQKNYSQPNLSPPSYQQMYSQIIFILNTELGIQTKDHNMINILLRAKLKQLNIVTKDQQQQIIDLTMNLQKIKKQYYHYLVQITANQLEQHHPQKQHQTFLQIQHLNRQIHRLNKLLQHKSELHQNLNIAFYKTNQRQIALSVENNELKMNLQNLKVQLHTLKDTINQSDSRGYLLGKYLVSHGQINQ